jgi:aminoglycoside 2''-phosphotransferase
VSLDSTVESCVRAIAGRYPDLYLRTCRPAQQGWDSTTLLVNDELIFRFARRPDVAERLEREVRLLPAIADLLPVSVPRFEFVCDDPDGGKRFVGYRAIPGVPLDDPRVPKAQLPMLAMQLGAFLEALHRFPVAEAMRLGVQGGTAQDWRQEYRGLYADMRAHVIPLLTVDEQARETARWEDFLEDENCFHFQSALIHRDLGPEHVLCDPATGALTGVIDWGDASIGDPAHDLTGVYSALGQALAERVLAAASHATEPGIWRRVVFYAGIVPYYAIRFGQLEGNASVVERGLAALRGA